MSRIRRRSYLDILFSFFRFIFLGNNRRRARRCAVLRGAARPDFVDIIDGRISQRSGLTADLGHDFFLVTNLNRCGHQEDPG